MQPHEERVIQEKKELDEKINKLGIFFNVDTYKNLSENEQYWLARQYETMIEYSTILSERIKLFGK